MQPASTSRRNFLKNGLGSLGAVTLPAILLNGEPSAGKKIVVVGGHPDDPECGCGGTIARLADLGHKVVLFYLTNGDEGIEGKSHEQAATIRRAESIAACKILKATPLFANQVDGESVMNNPEMARFQKLLYNETPDVVFTHWPVDSHKDHQIASVLTMQAWMETPRPFTLYFYEVCAGYQTFGFHPTDYVDITDWQRRKFDALAEHKSQGIVVNGKYSSMFVDCGHPAMEDFRGKELGVKAAEAFIRMNGRRMGELIL